MSVSDIWDHCSSPDIAAPVITTRTQCAHRQAHYARPPTRPVYGLSRYATNRFSRILRKSVAKLP